MSRQGNGGKAGPRPRGGRKATRKKASPPPPPDERAGRPDGVADAPSAIDAWLAVEVDESAIQMVPQGAEESPGAAAGPRSPGDARVSGGAVEPARSREGEARSLAVPRRAASAARHLDLLCFGLERETFGIDIRDVKEIIRARPATELPGVPDFIRGIISLRGQILTVVDLRRRLGFPPLEDLQPSSRIIVAATEEWRAGILVDEVTRKARVPLSAMSPPPAHLGSLEASFLHGVCRHEGRLISVLYPPTVLSLGGSLFGRERDKPATGEPA